jgi:hypothetical protein
MRSLKPQRKKMGLRITRDVIVRNIEKIYRAHLTATQVELEIAVAIEANDHIEDRLCVIGDWINDPLVPMELKDDYENLYISAKRLLTR